MARTKQTARKSSGGKAPRQQLATKSSRQLRTYLTSQQASSSGKKKIFINYENTFSNFSFNRTPGREVPSYFEPKVVIARCASENIPHTMSTPQYVPQNMFMKIDFSSCLDGNITAATRPPLDVVFVLDVSGSMGSPFPDDSDHRSKLAVAKNCVDFILGQMLPSDRASIVTFTTTASTVQPLQHLTDANRNIFKSSLQGIHEGGGTSLALGLAHGFNELSQVKSSGPAVAASPQESSSPWPLSLLTRSRRKTLSTSQAPRMSRVFFLTDMESSSADEASVLEIANLQAVQNSQYLSVIGIGVDLSVETVEKISAIPGAKYSSVVNAAEFMASVAVDFNYDVTPIAFGISLKLQGGLSFLRVYGSAELNSLPEGSTQALISSEFPVSLDASNNTYGGVYLCHLRYEPAYFSSFAAPTSLLVQWTDPFSGQGKSREIALTLPEPLSNGDVLSPDCDIGLRKSLVLAEYVRCLTDFAVHGSREVGVENDDDSDDDDDDDNDDDGPTFAPMQHHRFQTANPRRLLGVRRHQVPFQQQKKPRTEKTTPSAAAAGSASFSVASLKLLSEQGAAGIVAMTDISALPADTPQKILQHYRTVRKFINLRSKLVDELAACDDTTLTSENTNVMDTVEQIITFERESIDRFLAKVKSDRLDELTAAAPSGVPRGLMCPITLSIMRDPVIAADGHSYERRAIENWLRSHTVSPTTNLPLSHPTLTPNISLKMVIDEYIAKQEATASAATAASVETVGVAVVNDVANLLGSPTRRQAPRKAKSVKF